MRRALVAVVVFGALGLGCDSTERGERREARDEETVAVPVAMVGGRAIGAADVRARMELDGLDANQALDSLIREELLFQEAYAAGLSPDAEAERGVDRMMVRALLRDLEAEHEPEDISERAVREAFREDADAYQVPEKRAVTHLLVKDQTESAREVAASALAEARQAEDPAAALERYAASGASPSDPAIIVESIPAMPESAQLKKAFINAVFAAKSLGPLNKPVRTSYGWHAIVVTDIEPAESPSLRDVEDEIREALSLEARFETMAALVRGLEEEGLVVYQQETVDRLLAASEVPRRAE